MYGRRRTIGYGYNVPDEHSRGEFSTKLSVDILDSCFSLGPRCQLQPNYLFARRSSFMYKPSASSDASRLLHLQPALDLLAKSGRHFGIYDPKQIPP
jgi:hypothetical protein